MERSLLLVNPRCGEGSKYPPLSLIWLASYIEKQGYFVDIIDANALELRDEDLIQNIIQAVPSFCGFTFMTPQADYVADLFKRIKRIQPGIILLAGGVHVSTVPDDFLTKCPEVDYLVIGEGELTLLELMESLIQGKDVGDIPGIAFVRENRIQINPRRALLPDLNELPMPAWDKLPIHKYNVVIPERDRVSSPGECLSISSGRGCPFQCTFCASGSVFGKTFRNRSPYNTFMELQYLARNYGVCRFFIVDEVLTLKESAILELCDLIEKSELSISWACCSRCNSQGLTERALAAMKKSGCVRIDLGVESGSPKVLKQIRKGITLEDIYRAHKKIHDIGMYTTTLMMFGQPDETIDDFRMSLKMMLYLESEVVSMGPATPFPGTELYDYAVKNNHLRVAHNDWKEFDIGNINHIMRTKHFSFDELVEFAYYGDGVGDIIAKLSNYKRHGEVTILNTLRLFVSILFDVVSWLPIDHKALWINLFLLKRNKPEYVNSVIKSMPIALKEIRSFDFSLNWEKVSRLLHSCVNGNSQVAIFAGTPLGITSLMNNLKDSLGKDLQIKLVPNNDASGVTQGNDSPAMGGGVLGADFDAIFYLENRKNFYVLFNIGMKSIYYHYLRKVDKQFIVYPNMIFWEISLDNILIALTGKKNRRKAFVKLLSVPFQLVYQMYLTIKTEEMTINEKIVPPDI